MLGVPRSEYIVIAINSKNVVNCDERESSPEQLNSMAKRHFKNIQVGFMEENPCLDIFKLN